jgi:voltage-gated potassium channel Kch
MKFGERFSPTQHIPHYTKLLFDALFTPILIFFTLGGNFILIISTFLFHWFEAEKNPLVDNLLDSLWWAVCTISTVGFGDVVPVTTEGRLVGIFLIIMGILFFAGFTATFASILFAVTTRDLLETDRLTRNEYLHVMKSLEDITLKFDRHIKRPSPTEGSESEKE